MKITVEIDVPYSDDTPYLKTTDIENMSEDDIIEWARAVFIFLSTEPGTNWTIEREDHEHPVEFQVPPEIVNHRHKIYKRS